MGGGPALASRRPGFTAKRCGFSAAGLHQISVTIRRSSPAMTMTPASLFRLGLLAALLAAPLPAQAQSEQKPPSVTVTGEASISKAPDIAILRGGRDQPGQDRARGHDGERQVDDGRARFAERKRHRRERYPDHRGFPFTRSASRTNNPANIIAVEASSLITVRVRDINKSADVLDGMISAGANLATGINFEVSDASKLARSGPDRSDRRRQTQSRDLCQGRRRLARPSAVDLGRLYLAAAIRGRLRDARASPRRCRSSRAKKKSGSTCQVSYELLR